MANINKSFNFRNGVQVDEDNFIVNANGLVGIGTSIPREILDVYGTAKITGLVTTTNLAVSGVSTFYSDVKIGSGITLSSSGNITAGIVTAITFYGSASGLTGIVAISTNGWIVNAGTLSTTSRVGIGTTFPYYSLQVGNDPLTGNGFSVDGLTGNVNSTGISTFSTLKVGAGVTISGGIVTATSFVGSLTGNVNSTGISTFSTLKVGTGVTISGGIVTATSFVGSLTGDINSTGISTFSTLKVGTGVTISGGIVTATSFVGSLTGNVTGIASTALSLDSSGSISVTSATSSFASLGIATITNSLYVVGYPAKVGVGTTTEPGADIEVYRTGISSIRVISANNIATIGIGRSAEIRTGNTDTNYPYSPNNSLDIINSNPGHVNHYLHYGSAGIGTGSFNWIYGQDITNPRMSLTYNGNLGLGITNPSTRLYVVGTSFITGITTIDNSLKVNTDLTVSNNATVSNNLNVTGNITFNGTITGNLGITTLARLGIATNTISNNSYELVVGGDPVFGPGVAITTTGIRASGIIEALTLKSTSGVITATTFSGNATSATTAGGLTGTPNINVSNIYTSSIGIGTTTPIQTFQIGTTDSSGINTEGKIFVVTSNADVGIGTTNPTSKLHVVGDVYVTGITTSQQGFTSGIGITNPVKITVSGNILTFTVPGVGTTSLTLF